jgi:hypothetical protein
VYGEAIMQIQKLLENSTELDNPVFVVGCPRSGTSVLARIIGLSKGIRYFGETKLIPKVYVRRIPISLAVQYWKDGEALCPILKGKLHRLKELILGTDPLKEIITRMIKHTHVNDYDLSCRNGPLIDRYSIVLTATDTKLAHELYHKYRLLAKIDIDRMTRVLFKDFQLLSGCEFFLEKTPAHAFYITY